LKIRFEKLTTWPARLAVIIATFFGSGLLPAAPGTFGALAAVPLVYLTVDCHWAIKVALWLIVAIAGTWAAKTVDQVMGSEDNQSIVVDEALGYGITAWTASTHWQSLLAAFILFRFFDIVKPFPVRQIDRWSKKKAGEHKPGSQAPAWWGGFGVMADDLVAGLQGLVVMLVLQHFGVLP
jgi:phosphatidylglycerophosphatase A